MNGRIARSLFSWLAVFGLLSSCAFLLGMKGEPFRFTRAIEAAPGWSVLELPVDVLDQTQPHLVDLRIRGDEGELSYELEPTKASSGERLTLLDVERVPGRETSALIDRGEKRVAGGELTLEVAGAEPFLKPVVVEASDDRQEFREIARSSLFRVQGTSMTTVRFPESDRRYWRVRFDDRESAPINATTALFSGPPATPQLRSFDVAFRRVVTDSTTDDTYSIQLPAQHLPLVSLRVNPRQALFSRSVRVFERILFRDQPSRRQISSGQIARGASGEALLEVPLGEVSGTRLELDVERVGSPLDLVDGSVSAEPVRIVFLAPAHGSLQLWYGSPTAEPPQYDLAGALALGSLPRFQPAKLGAALDHGSSPAPAPLAHSRGSVLDDTKWSQRAPVTLPKEGRVAYLDLGAEVDASARIIDQQHRQVPYVAESGFQYETKAAPFSTGMLPDHTTDVSIQMQDPRQTVVALTLTASSPEFFTRKVTAFELASGEREPPERRELASGLWQREPRQPALPFTLPIEALSQPVIKINIENGDNEPLQLVGATIKVQRRRIDFLFEPGDQLALVFGNPEVGPPSYDLTLLAPTLIASPAQAAHFEVVYSNEPKGTRPASAWLWIAVVVSAGLVLLALLRILRSEPAKG